MSASKANSLNDNIPTEECETSSNPLTRCSLSRGNKLSKNRTDLFNDENAADELEIRRTKPWVELLYRQTIGLFAGFYLKSFSQTMSPARNLHHPFKKRSTLGL